MPRALRVATRGSALARVQAQRVVELLGVAAELVVVSTIGDERPDTPIHAMGGTGVFTKEVQQALLDDRADLAVHSAKDLPASGAPDGIVLASVPERADVRDALVGAALADLATGARVGTGSVRRRAQLAALRPDLEFGELRGNIATRLGKAAQYDAIVVAAAALARLGRLDAAAQVLDPDLVLPQVGQGALAVECRVDDHDTRERLAAIDDTIAHAAVGAERAFLATLGGGCDLPCAALARVEDGAVVIDALLASPDGATVVRSSARDHSPLDAGQRVAGAILDQGGRALLDDAGSGEP